MNILEPALMRRSRAIMPEKKWELWLVLLRVQIWIARGPRRS